LPAEAVCEFYNILQTDLPGHTSAGATSVGGAIQGDNWIQYTFPLAGKTTTGNKFWDRPPATETPLPTETPPSTPTNTRATDTPTQSPTPTTTLPADCSELVENGDFESGSFPPWRAAGEVGLGPGREGGVAALLGGSDEAEGELFQQVAIPASAAPVRLHFWWLAETEGEQVADVLEVIVQHGGGADNLLTLRAVAPIGVWMEQALDLTPYAGETIFATFLVHTDSEVPSVF
jgi:hypothetical protein